MESNAIRLTNRTAIALRRQAKRTRNAYFVMGAVSTLLLLALAAPFLRRRMHRSGYWGLATCSLALAVLLAVFAAVYFSSRAVISRSVRQQLQ